MIKLGESAKHIRTSKGLTQREAARRLRISNVHLSNIENNKASPSLELVERYRALWNVDLYVLAWCTFGDVKRLPVRLRKPTIKLAEAWKQELGRAMLQRPGEQGCSDSDK